MKRLTRGSITATGSTNAGAKDQPGQAQRLPKLRHGVANDVSPVHPRSAIMPSPMGDTPNPPYLSKSGVTTSPANIVRPNAGPSRMTMPHVKSGGAAPFVSKTPPAAPAGKYPRGKR